MRRKIFILHEIYGVNDFIKKQARTYSDANTSVECISLYQNAEVFTYNQEKEAYDYYIQEIGFDKPLQKLTTLLMEAKNHYQEVVVMGFSVGATLAWRLSTYPIDRIICLYGSRIRQYMDIHPTCPTLVILPNNEKSFDVNELKHGLEKLPNVQVSQFSGNHGFMDDNNLNYCQQSYQQAQSEILRFLRSKSFREDLE
ncbi:dienelactone hydrolase family protein [Lysinibacillus sp. NPDC097195]|uniref:dienelactone hydrolase family protein n=1 Tax=Lysinibacillus sp. NPDC097195 TaxID=3364141 RepID=UPI0038140A17